jgi:uracil-DNA glycosylase
MSFSTNSRMINTEKGGLMTINRFTCDYPCNDIKPELFFPKTSFDRETIKVVMVSECPPSDRADYFYEQSSGSFFQTTKIAFGDAGIEINNYADLTDLGFYLTTAIKCHKTQYVVSAQTIKECALRFLRTELGRFPNIKVIMCMGDFAIKAINYVYKEKHNVRPISAGSTYKIRQEKHIFNGIRFFPSYTQTGDSFNIEKSKRRMIAEDIKGAIACLR